MATPFIFFIMGLVLFLFGMMQLSAGVQTLLSARIRAYIRYSVRRPFYGLLVGTLSTILLQSSTATSVIAVGIVGAGLITFYHSLGIILGADIGTTLTVQLVVWKVTALSPLIISVGGALWITGKDRRKAIGEVIFYFGLMFFGLDMMSQATAPLKGNPLFMSLLQSRVHPMVGLIVGIAFTAIVHASSIPISVLVILAQQGLVGIDNALPVVFGANIGTTATVALAGITMNISGKRTAAAHVTFKAVGAVIAFAILPLFVDVLNRLSDSTAQQIALAHFLFNVLILIVFFFILKPFARLMERLLPGEEHSVPLWPEFLRERALALPEKALECVHKELKRQLAFARETVVVGRQLILAYDEGKKKNASYIKLVIDNLQKEIVTYLLRVSTLTLTAEHSRTLLAYTAMAGDFSSIGNHAMNLVDLAQQKQDNHITFTSTGTAELAELGNLLEDSLDQALILIDAQDGARKSAIERILANEDQVDHLIHEYRSKQLHRFHNRECQAEAGPIFLEALINMERISDHCENVAQYFQKHLKAGGQAAVR